MILTCQFDGKCDRRKHHATYLMILDGRPEFWRYNGRNKLIKSYNVQKVVEGHARHDRLGSEVTRYIKADRNR